LVDLREGRRTIFRRFTLLVLGSTTLGLGVALLLNTHLGSDGYSTLLQGTSIALAVPFVVATIGLATLFVGIGWLRGLRPGWGTVIQPVSVGVVVTLVMPYFPEPSQLPWRIAQFALGLLVLCVGIAAYLAADLGIGPAEVVARAFDPPLPFRWSYSILQVIFALIGWQLGGDLGLGTILASFALGPVVTFLSPPFLRFALQSR
jgi:uncharacterized protein